MGSDHRTVVVGRRSRLVQPPRLITSLLLMLPLLLSPPALLCSVSSVITHLPGFHGRLPFYLETGYVDVDEETGTELFYYFVESERNSDTDPLILWLTGGPRCSGFCGLVYEVGPINFVVEPYNGSLPQLVYNPYSWTQMASILFLDTPVGSGFSYAHDPKGYDVGDMSSSLQVVTFLKKWFNDHPRYLSHHFYLGGTSYAGKGYIVGNPITGSKIGANFKVPYSHGFGIISDQLYEAATINCKGDYVTPANELCAKVVNAINNLMSEVETINIVDNKCVYNTPKPINGISGSRTLLEHVRLSEPADQPTISCSTYNLYLSYIWMNNNVTRDALRIKKGTIGVWLRCNNGFPYAIDVPSNIEYHFNLTRRGYRALVISGDHDLMVPFLGTQAWIRSFNFSIVDDWRAWHVDGQAAGFTIMYANNLTFATVKGGSHVAISSMPKQGFAMGQRWLENKPL